MSAPVPEFHDAPAPSNSGLISAADANAVVNAKGFSVPAMLSALKAAPAFSRTPVGSVGNPSLDQLSGGAPKADIGGALKNIIDFVETPLYMLTNTVDNALTRQDHGDNSFNIDDLTKGVQQGIDAGINHNPAYAKDWIDVAKHNIAGTPLENTQVGKDLTNITGGIGDMIVDPINLIPGTGVGKTVLKSPGIIAGALRDASKTTGLKVAKAADEAAAATAEPLARAEVRGSGDAADAAGSAVPETGADPAEAPTALYGPDEAKAQFQQIPEIAKVLKAQDMGPTQSVLSALGQELKTNWQASDANRMLQGIKDFMHKPLPVAPENVEKAHVIAAESPTLKDQPVTTMAPVEKPVDPHQDIIDKHFPEATDQYHAVKDIVDSSPYHPFAKGQTSMWQDWLRRVASPEEKANVASKLGLAEGTAPHAMIVKMRELKDPYMKVEKEISAIHAKNPETPVATANKAASKMEDLNNSAAQNTLQHNIWESTPPEQRQAIRNQMASTKWQDLKKPMNINVQVDRKVAKDTSTRGTLEPFETQAAASNVLNSTLKHQLQDAPEIGKKGFRGDPARMKGKSSEEAGAITHPFLYDNHANLLPTKETIEQIKHLSLGTEDGVFGGLGAGRKISSFEKPGIFKRIIRAVETQLQAKGMIPYMNMSKYFKGTNAIHLTLGDTIEAALAKTIAGIKDKSIISHETINKHLIGSDKKNMINPLTWTVANETLLHERKIMFDELKAKNLAVSPEALSQGMERAEKAIHDVLMVKPSAFRSDVTKEDLQNMAGTMMDAMEARQAEGIETSYAKDMKALAHAMVFDPQYGSMLESRHLYNAAMHEADLVKYAAHNLQDLIPKLQAFAATDMTPQKITKWMDGSVKDAMAVLPEADRKAYQSWTDYMLGKLITPEEKVAVAAKDARETIKDSGKAAEEAYKESGTDYTHIDLELGKIATDTLRSIHPVRTFFDAKFPFLGSDFYNVVKMGEHSQSRLISAFNQHIYGWLMKYNKTGDLHDAFKNIVKGSVDASPLTPEAQELNKVVNVLFGDDQRYMNSIKSGTLPKTFLEKVWGDDKYGILGKIDSKWWSSATKDNLGDFYKHVNLKDSTETADFLSKLHASVVHMNNQLSLARSFEERFGSKVATADHVKLSWSNKGKSSGVGKYYRDRMIAEKAPGLWELLDKDLHYDKAAAWELPAIHRLINESRAYDGPLKDFVNNIFDPMTQVMKATQTTLRPGHWVSNVLGDTIRNFLAGVYDIRSYGYNMRVMAAIGRDEKLFSEGIGSKFERSTMIANGKYADKIPASERKHMVPIRIKGNVQYFTATEIGRMMEDRIFLSPHGVGGHEDYITPEERNITNALSQHAVNATDKMLSNRFYDLNKWSAVRDNLTRGALAIDTLIHGDHASIEAAMEKAFTRVRKWAPTSADFTREESMYARRALLYYTWIRGMIPNILETMVERPGVFMTPNKLLYAQAKANGVNPMSIGNPFPINQQFPSYYYENVIGPQFQAEGGQLWGYSPMAPSIDVMQTIMKPNPAANLLSMANPLAKIPIEMATQQSNGIPIKDNAQYLQDNLLPPQLDMISKATGKELYNPQQNRTDKGNSMPVPGTGIPADVFNFFTGLHATDYNSPADIRSVVAENKTAKSALRSDVQRNNR